MDAAEDRERISQTDLFHYTYNWPVASTTTTKTTTTRQHTTKPGRTTTQAVVFGLGSMFNHSSRGQNVGWTRDVERRLVVYRALRHISAGEELCISYGDRLTFADAERDDDDDDDRAEDVLGKIELASSS